MNLYQVLAMIDCTSLELPLYADDELLDAISTAY